MSYLQVKNVVKSFGNNKVLENISIDFEKGEIHSIIGENGAGKSTLMKIIGGIYQADSGEVLLDGRNITMRNPVEAYAHGIGIVHQELSIAGNMTVAQNVFVNHEPVNRLGFIDWDRLYKNTEEEFQKIGANINPRVQAGTLSVGLQQMIEITKVLSKDVNILILDEPTSALSDKEIENLFRLLFDLREKGKLIIFISHKLNEITRISDKVSVLRDGTCTGTLTRDNMDVDMTVRENTIAACLKSICSSIQFIKEDKSRSITKTYIEELEIHPSQCMENRLSNLSGGNQQKVLFAKWLAANPKLLIVDEPTRGVDVGAKAMIHEILRRLADSGMAVWMISSELPEILGVSDKVIVMHEGKCQAVLENDNLTEEIVMKAAFREEVEGNG